MKYHTELNFCSSLSAHVVAYSSVKAVVFHCKGMQREGFPLPKPTEKGPVQPTECLNAQTVNEHRFSQLPTTRKQTPYLLPLCVHPLPSEGETRDNDSLITQGKYLKAAHHLRGPPGYQQILSESPRCCLPTSLLADSSFSSKSPQQDEDKSHFILFVIL